MNHALYRLAEWLSKPPGFWWLMGLMVIATGGVPLGLTNMITYILSVLAIVITGVVLIQGFRDTAAIQAKLDELILALETARNEVVGLEKKEPDEIAAELAKREGEAEG